MLSFDEFSVNAQFLSVVKRDLIVDSVRLVKPYVNLVRTGTLPITSATWRVGTTPPEAKEQRNHSSFDQ
jgi:hypothetical protein